MSFGTDPSRPTGLRQLIRRLPGMRWLHEILWQSPGTWLYRRPTLSWLSDPELVRQLPRSYRCFARYCAAQGFDPIGAETLLRAIIALHGGAEGGGIAELRVAGVAVFLDLRDPRFLDVPSELARLPSLLARFVGAGDTFIDVGANHGAFSITAARLVGGEGMVISIEPQPRLADVVRRSLARTGTRFEVYQLACGDRSDELDFYIPRATSGSGGVFGAFSAVSRHRTIRVAMRRMDDLLASRALPGRVFVKLDVEGSELSFLHGAGQFIRATAPLILIEMNPPAMRAAGTSREVLLRALAELGYDRFVTPARPDFERPLADDCSDTDLIVLPAKTAVRRT